MHGAVPVPEGGVPVSHRRIVAIAVPMTLAHITTPLLGIADMAVVGRLGEAHLVAAVAIGAMLCDFLFWAFGFLRMGTTGLTAQALGARDDVEMRASFARAMVIGLGSALLLIALQGLIATIAFPLIGASAEVEAAARTYFTIRVWSAPFAFANYVVLGWFLGRAEATIGLLLQVLINGLNVAFSVSLALGLGWGIAGVAFGTLLGEAVSALVGSALVLWRLGGRLDVPRAVLFDRRKIIETVAVSRDIMIRTLALMFAFSFFTAQGVRFGEVALAANAVLEKFWMFGAYFLDGFATAAEQICGQAVGARDRGAFRRAVNLCLVWAHAIGAAIAACLLLAGPFLIAAMTTNADIRAVAAEFLPYAAAAPLIGAAAFVFDGVYVGATWGPAMRNLMVAALALYLAAAYGLMASFGNHGLWQALSLFLLARGVLQYAGYRSLAARSFAAA